MPTVNIYYKSESDSQKLQNVVFELKKFLVEKLSCGEIKLTPEEISVRFILVCGGNMIGDIEIEITAHAFGERVKKQDEICREVMAFVQKEVSTIGNVKVWLKLCELGHSW